MGTIQAWILSSALPGSGGYRYFFLGYGSGHGRSFFILFWGVIWTEVTEANMSQFVERAPSESAQDSRLDSEILRRQGWRHLGVTPFPPCHHSPGKREAKLDC